MAQPEKRDEFDAIRASIKELERVFGGRMVIKEWNAGDVRYLKAVITWKNEANKSQVHQLVA